MAGIPVRKNFARNETPPLGWLTLLFIQESIQLLSLSFCRFLMRRYLLSIYNYKFSGLSIVVLDLSPATTVQFLTSANVRQSLLLPYRTCRLCRERERERESTWKSVPTPQIRRWDELRRGMYWVLGKRYWRPE
jgi:hypothetical protein